MNGRPKAILNGVNDQSFALASSTTDVYPPYFPIIPFTSERGIEDCLVFSDRAAYVRMYGNKHLDIGQSFYTHAAHLLKTAGAFMAKRIVSPMATHSMLRVSAELALYTDNSVAKHRAVFYNNVDAYPVQEKDFGQATVIENFRVGNLTVPPISNLNLATMLFPIMDVQIYSKGSFGNQFKLELISNFENGRAVHAFKIFDKGVLLATTEFFDLLLTSDDFIEKKLQEAVAIVVDGMVYSIAIGRVKIYKSELMSFLNAISLERTVSGFTVSASGAQPHAVDFLTGNTEEEPIPFYSSSGSLGLGGVDPTKPFRFNNGSDGVALTVLDSPELLDHTRILDLGVQDIFSGNVFDDRLKFPFNTVVDTGYSLDTKKSIIAFSQRHKDILPLMTPFRYADFVQVIEPPPPVVVTYSAIASATTVNEGSSVTINFLTTNFGTGTLYWNINPVASPFLNAMDFGSPMSGSVNIVNDVGSTLILVNADQTTEGNEQFNVLLRVNSVNGNIVATSQTVTIVDTSVDPVVPPVGIFLNTNPVVNQSNVQGIQITLTQFGFV